MTHFIKLLPVVGQLGSRLQQAQYHQRRRCKLQMHSTNDPSQSVFQHQSSVLCQAPLRQPPVVPKAGGGAVKPAAPAQRGKRKGQTNIGDQASTKKVRPYEGVC